MSEETKRLTLVELMKTPEYQRLTQKQRLFVATYCEGGLLDGNYDSVAATRTAYQCKSAETARIMSYSLMQNIRIVAALNRHFNATPTDEFMLILDRAINNKNLTMAQLGALKLKCDLMGIKTMIPDDHTTISRKQSIVAETNKEIRKSQKKEAPEKKPAKSSEYEDEARTL